MPRPTAIGVPCDICGKDEYWDNTQNKKNPKAPDWSCANKECPGKDGYKFGRWERDRAKWDPNFKKGNAPKVPTATPAPQGGRLTPDDTTPDEQGQRVFTYEALCYTYGVLVRKVAEAMEKAKLPLDPQAVNAGVATMLIQGEKAHIPLLHPRKPVPEPVQAPKPKKELPPFVQEEFEEVSESELPF